MGDGQARELHGQIPDLHAELTARTRSAMRGGQDAEDIAQESWLRLSAAMVQGRPIANFRTYLFRIARNLVFDHYRREKARPDVVAPEGFVDQVADPAPNAEARLVTRDELRRMDAIIAAMPAKARRVFRLARIEGLSFAEIARLTGVSRQTVHDHMTRAMIAIQLAAEDEEM